MPNIFLAEDFRNLLTALENIAEDSTDKDVEKQKDVDDLLTTDRPTNIAKESVKNIYDLISYLDQFDALSKYRNENASYDDAFYEDIPLNDLESASGITLDDLNNIADNTDAYEGDYYVYNNKVSIFGGS